MMTNTLNHITPFTMILYFAYLLMAEPVLILRRPVKGTRQSYRWTTIKIVLRYVAFIHLVLLVMRDITDHHPWLLVLDAITAYFFFMIVKRDRDDDNFFNGLGTKIKNFFTIKRLDTAFNVG